MRYGSVCSGVEAAGLAWRPLGWTAAFFAEVEPFPAAVLMERFGATRPLRPLDPAAADSEKERKSRESWARRIADFPAGGAVPNFGDFSLIKKGDVNEPIDLLVGGTPCQDLSIAGRRLGFEGRRSALALDFARLCFELGVRWVVWENVPAALSSRRGGDFARFVSLLCGWDVPVPERGWRKCGIVTPAPGCFGVAWRILDAQYTRVEQFPRAIPQRRRRIFVVGYSGQWKYPAKVLFDGEMFGGDTPPRRTARQGAASGSEDGADRAEQSGLTRREDGCAPQWWNGRQVADTLTVSSDRQLMPDRARLQCVVEKPGTDCRRGETTAPESGGTIGFIKNDAGGVQQGFWDGIFPTIRSQATPAVAIAENVIGRSEKNGGNGVGAKEEVAYTQNCTGVMGVSKGAAVRRLLPVECERLMGFPDNWTRIPWMGKPAEECPDAPRYKACGNSMCVNVMAWLGERIQKAEEEIRAGRGGCSGARV